MNGAQKQSSSILIKNATVFDGHDELSGTQDVLIKDNRISKVGPHLKADEKTKIIDAKGKFLMPGLSDAHWHTIFAAASFEDFNMPDQGLVLATAIEEAKRTVLRGFTTVRDVAGGVFGIKKAIDKKIIKGPRIFPSGAFVSQSAGHGDMREITNPPSRYGGIQSVMEKSGDFVLADGVDEVLTAVRWQLKKGASQIKIGAGGGVISHFDPMDSLQFTLPEIRAATSAAKDWGTYVCSHVYSDAGVNRAIDGGVKSIEHGHFATEKTIKRMADEGIWLSIQPFEANQYFPKAPPGSKGAILDGVWRKTLGLALKNKCNYAFGTDLLFDAFSASGQNYMLYLFSEVLGPLNALRVATSGNAKLMAMSGERNPYIQAELGVIKPGAWADVVLVDGNPLRDFKLIYQYEDKFNLIIKDGDIIKNTIG
ncbi:hypothetical protein BKH42_00485 [Helicobacter sp. 13S00482-2]|nr:hypothetical protein BKH42_00485 [Helicobacter sp. 13S00482-2]